MWISLCFFIFVFIITNVWCQDFGYDGTVGPSYWGQKYHQCIGKHQSPINIEDNNVEKIKLYPMHFENFDVVPVSGEMINNGHTVVLNINSTKRPMIYGGPLIGKYEFASLHFHWGSHDYEGSENKINNNSFPMELHMVFFQKAYGTFNDAIEHPDGLTVLAFLFSNSKKPNTNYTPITDALKYLEEPTSSKVLKTVPTLNSLIMQNRSIYYTYGGSLTTPPCSEVVTWIEFKNTIPMAHEQIEAFRHLKDEHGRNMSHNFRPTQPLHGRLIRMVVNDPDDIKKEHLTRNSSQKQNIWTILSIVLPIIADLYKYLYSFQC